MGCLLDVWSRFRDWGKCLRVNIVRSLLLSRRQPRFQDLEAAGQSRGLGRC